jgi:hypothetical protein
MSQAEVVAQEAARGEDWLAILDAYGAQFLVLDALTDRRLLQLAQSHPHWTVDCTDGESVLLARVAA